MSRSLTKDELKEKYDVDYIISYSQLKKYTSCPRQWYLDYVEDQRLLPSDTIHTIGGTGFHEAMQTYIKDVHEKSTDPFDYSTNSLYNLYLNEFEKALIETCKSWKDVDDTPTTSKESIEYASTIKDVFKEFDETDNYFIEPNKRLEGIETPVHMRVNENVAFIGYIDVLFKNNDGTYTIVDIKTSTKGWDKFKKQDTVRVSQLVLYRTVLAKMLDIPEHKIDIVYWIVAREPNYWTKSVIDIWNPLETKYDPDELKHEVIGHLQAFMNGAFPNGKRVESMLDPKPKKFNCAFCPFSAQFGNQSICDHETFDDYPKGMAPYIDEQYIK